MIPIWNTQLINLSLLFEPISLGFKPFADYPQWPTINDYNQLLSNKNLKSKLDKSLLCTPQPPQKIKNKNFDAQYEPSIYLYGKIPTRENSWHDFYNIMVWLTFPKTKAEINAQQYTSLKARLGISKNRTMLENVLTLFDENGAIIISHNEELLQLLKDFRWKELFWQRREQVMSQMRCYIFGHSIYEKALNPYLGMTASSIIFLVSKDFFAESLEIKLQSIDERLSDFFVKTGIQATKEFMPLPILGFPGWNVENESQSYYDNVQYFRSKKHEKEILKLI